MGKAGDGMRNEHVGKDKADSMTFAANLRRLLRERRMTQMQLSTIVGTSPSATCLWCQGRSVPYATTLKRIALALGCSCDELLKGVGE